MRKTITALAARQQNLLPAGSIWKYLDDASLPGAFWNGSGPFDDSAWPSGPAQLGYGDGDEATTLTFGGDPNNKTITTYYRKAFVVTNATQITNLIAHVIRDDGVVVYLNGQEAFRDNLPGGAINFATLALTAIAGAQESIAFITDIVPVAGLINGTNILAAEIHQQSGKSHPFYARCK